MRSYISITVHLISNKNPRNAKLRL